MVHNHDVDRDRKGTPGMLSVRARAIRIDSVGPVDKAVGGCDATEGAFLVRDLSEVSVAVEVRVSTPITCSMLPGI